jgi:two-component system sensor histidine kinase VicK
MYFLRLRDVTSAFQENRLRWSFHDIVSHKFQTPLALLEGFLEILQDPTLDDVRRKVLIEESLKSTRLLQGEVDAIFRYLQAPDLADLGDNVSLGKVVQIFRNICVRLEMPASYILNPYPENIIIGLPMQAIETILRELVQNAIKFHPQQKPKMQLEIICHENEIVLQVADNGLGLPASELDRIWTPYFQVDDGFSGEQPGMGLGLSMIAMIVLSAGGRCRSFNRTDGTGLVVELQLPLANEG